MVQYYFITHLRRNKTRRCAYRPPIRHHQHHKERVIENQIHSWKKWSVQSMSCRKKIKLLWTAYSPWHKGIKALISKLVNARRCYIEYVFKPTSLIYRLNTLWKKKAHWVRDQEAEDTQDCRKRQIWQLSSVEGSSHKFDDFRKREEASEKLVLLPKQRITT